MSTFAKLNPNCFWRAWNYSIDCSKRKTMGFHFSVFKQSITFSITDESTKTYSFFGCLKTRNKFIIYNYNITGINGHPAYIAHA